MASALFVFHADRGHFNFCFPLARALSKLGWTCELWTNSNCSDWVIDGVFHEVRFDALLMEFGERVQGSR